MKIVIFGLTVSSSWGNGHATLWRGLCRALARRGHRVVFFERDVPYYEEHRDLTDLPHGRLILYKTWDDVRSLARRELSGADVGLTTSYCIDALAATELMGETSVRVRAFYDMDTPVTLERLAHGEQVFYIGPRGLRDYDLVFSFTGGRALEALHDQLGAVRVTPLYGHVDPEVHRPVKPIDAYRADLSYLGTYAEDRQAALERLFVVPARRLAAKRFVIGGALYPSDFPWTENIYFVRHLPPGEHPAFFSSSRLTLNITRAAMREMGYCPSGRLFEAAACGTPILSDPWEGFETFFEPGRQALLAETTEDVTAALELSDDELMRIALAARERTLEEHTAARRARDFEVALDAVPQPVSEVS